MDNTSIDEIESVIFIERVVAGEDTLRYIRKLKESMELLTLKDTEDEKVIEYGKQLIHICEVMEITSSRFFDEVLTIMLRSCAKLGDANSFKMLWARLSFHPPEVERDYSIFSMVVTSANLVK